MRLGVSLNDERCFIAALPDTGMIHANLMLQDDQHGKRRRLKVFAHRFNEDETTTSLEWPIVETRVGDTLHLAIMPEGPGDSPEKQTSQPKRPAARMVESEALAARLLQLCSEFTNSLESLVSEVKTTEPPEQAEFLLDALESVFSSVEIQLRDPILLSHPSLGKPSG
jgi:hypothetical protein